MNSQIDYRTNSGTSFVGPDAVAFYRATVIAGGLRLYAKTGMQPNRAYTPRAMMRVASEITGKKFKARDYIGAADALKVWADTMKAALPKTLDGKVVA